MPKLFDRVKETTTTTGTGDITLLGAETNFRAFGDVLANNDVVFYAAVHQTLAEWEVGYCPWLTGNTLDRSAATILSSSNAGSAVNFSAGTKDVWCNMPAAMLADLHNADGQLLYDNGGYVGVMPLFTFNDSTNKYTLGAFTGSGSFLTISNTTGAGNIGIDASTTSTAGISIKAT